MKIFRNRTVIGVLCILLALIICFGVTPLFSRSASEKTDIVRVTKDIKEGDEITAEMVQTVEVGAYNLPQNLMTDKKEVVGKYATADLVAGDYILSSKLSAVPAAENAYLYNLDGTKQAISVTIKSFATGLSGKLESGDIVTVIVADYVACCGTSIQPVLQMLEQVPQLDTVLLCLDNDKAGHQASRRMQNQLEVRYSVERLIPENKDWNDDLTLNSENAQGLAMNEMR